MLEIFRNTMRITVKTHMNTIEKVAEIIELYVNRDRIKILMITRNTLCRFNEYCSG